MDVTVALVALSMAFDIRRQQGFGAGTEITVGLL